LFFIIAKTYERITNQINFNVNFQKISLYLIIFGFFTLSICSFIRVEKWKNDDTLFSDVIEKYSNCSIAYLNRGNFYKNYYAKKTFLNDDAKSKAYLNKAIKDFENSLKYEMIAKNKWRAYFNLGLTKIDLGDTIGAVKEFDKTLEFAPDNKYALLYRGAYFLNYYANKIFINDSTMRVMYIKRAINDFEKSLKYTLVPIEKVQLYNNLGIAKKEIQDYAGVIINYDSLINIDPYNIEAYRNRSDAKYQLKNYKGALDDCNKLLELNPQDANTLKNRDFVKSIIENQH
jgi:tetratricopeptide (TPR) repeat protein